MQYVTASVRSLPYFPFFCTFGNSLLLQLYSVGCMVSLINFVASFTPLCSLAAVVCVLCAMQFASHFAM